MPLFLTRVRLSSVRRSTAWSSIASFRARPGKIVQSLVFLSPSNQSTAARATAKYYPSISSVSYWPDTFRRMCDHDIPIASTPLRINSATQSNMEVLSSASKPHSTSNQIMTPKTPAASKVPKGPSEFQVARRYITQPINNTIPAANL